MKNITLALFFGLLSSLSVNAQLLTPDVDLVSEIISQKQEELKQRVLKNMVVKISKPQIIRRIIPFIIS